MFRSFSHETATHSNRVPFLAGLASLSLFLLACESTPTILSGAGAQVDDDDGGEQDDGPADMGMDTITDLGDGGAMGDGDDPGPQFTCGDGVLEPGELCDDGNTEDGDGCEGDCQSQDLNFDCSTPGEPCVNTVVCGNGVLEGDEVCDEGEGNETEGCSTECDAITDGWDCTRPGRSCVLVPVCGNGTRERGEQCDDGGMPPVSDDGCSATCQEEDPDGYFCRPGEKCTVLDCGDGVRTPNEQCDDNNEDNDDGCSDQCLIEDGYHCDDDGCEPICGDGIIIVGEEDCEDGNRSGGDGCSSACIPEPNFACPGLAVGDCYSTIRCGNNKIEPGEQCDYDETDLSYDGPCIKDDPDGDPPVVGCLGFEVEGVESAVCNDGIIQLGEECDGDGPLGEGCDDVTCQIEDDTLFACPVANLCVRIPQCGDGYLQPGEVCDVGASSSLACLNDCTEVADGYYCDGEGPDSCNPICDEDGVLDPGEECDTAGDTLGCIECKIQSGYICPPGVNCQPECGDGVVRAPEECDLNNAHCINCKLDTEQTCVDDVCTTTHWNCDDSTCWASVCGDGNTENGEACDDGTQFIDGANRTVSGDGCDANCQIEPNGVGKWPVPGDLTTCGDGLVTGSEECDDGNNVGGDGCTAGDCQEEDGWTCTESGAFPDAIYFKVTYRDFRQRDEDGGHPHMKVSGVNTPNSGASDLGIVGPVCAMSQRSRSATDGGAENSGTQDIPATETATNCGKLNSSGKPVYDGSDYHPHIEANWNQGNDTLHGQYFALWYADTESSGGLQGPNGNEDVAIDINPGLAADEHDTLKLDRQGSTDTYEFEDGGWWPLNGRGFGNTPGRSDNFQFTSELRSTFEYRGGETLTFYGDDDVWVFINGHLAVDIGGIHGQEYGRVVLGDDGIGTDATDWGDSDCSVHGLQSLSACSLGTNELDNQDERFGLTIGGVYEIAIFQAERHPGGSNYKLTLDGFIQPTSSCIDSCGTDTYVTGTELCDDGSSNTDNDYNACTTSCTYAFCGDGVHQTNTGGYTNSPEECDDGTTITEWVPDIDARGDACNAGCTLPDHCGDGELQPAHEYCDDGVNDGSYGGCAADCQSLGGYCGDGVFQDPDAHPGSTETCDYNAPGVTEREYGEGGCNYQCQPTPFCGDGTRNGPEACDYMDADAPPGCTTSCTLTEVCGDGLPNPGVEDCDYGEFADPVPDPVTGLPEPVYGGCLADCTFGPYCGDGEVHALEECDNGDTTGVAYGPESCTNNCVRGPRCGDRELQAAQGEYCDNGFNEDPYEYFEDACGPNCTRPPYCGDGIVQPDFELCDDGPANDDDAYEGCSSSCEWGPYCGDGIKQPEEACDLGSENRAYSPSGEGCGYDCQPAPYCGDGERNGPEQCDDGVNNTGEYGGCKPDCTRASYCGDGVVDADEGEACDDGPIGSFECSPTCASRVVR